MKFSGKDVAHGYVCTHFTASQLFRIELSALSSMGCVVGISRITGASSPLEALRLKSLAAEKMRQSAFQVALHMQT